MKLIHFSEKTLPKNSMRCMSPKIGLGKNGVIGINSSACDLISIKSGDRISISQDSKDTKNWYIFKDPNGFELRCGTTNKGFIFNHTHLIKIMTDALGLPADQTHYFLIAGKSTTIGGDKTIYWGLLAPAM